MKHNDLPKEHKIELVAGFALTGAAVGALTGYSWWNVPEGVLAGLLGAGAGALLGYSILLSPLEMLLSWVISLAPVFAGFKMAAGQNIDVGLGAALGGLGLGFLAFAVARKSIFPQGSAHVESGRTAQAALPAAPPSSAPAASAADADAPVDTDAQVEAALGKQPRVAPYRASRKKRK